MRIALCGFGVVGSGVFELLERRQESDVEIVKIFTRSPSKVSSLGLKNCITSQVEDVYLDESIDCVVELIGGVGVAWTIVSESLIRGKHVVTANKELVATKYHELTSLVHQHPGSRLLFEAAVCGSIPICSTLLKFDTHPIRICGIMNGTTNYVLSRIESSHVCMSEALEEARLYGYAESDSSFDINGNDSLFKLIILTEIGFNIQTYRHTDTDIVSCKDISGDHFYAAKWFDCTIKQVAVTDSTDSLEVNLSVMPTFVPLDSVLGRTTGANNAVYVKSKLFDDPLVFVGPGAGKYPTALSVIGDIMSCLHPVSSRRLVGAQYRAHSQAVGKFAIVFQSSTCLDMTSEFVRKFNQIESIRQREKTGPGYLTACVTENSVQYSNQVQNMCDYINTNLAIPGSSVVPFRMLAV